MNIFKRFMYNRQLEQDLQEAKRKISDVEIERDKWFQKYDEEKQQKWDIKRESDKLAKIVRKQAEADEVFASLRIVFNRLTDKPVESDKQWLEMKADAQARLRQVSALRAQSILSQSAFDYGQGLGSLGNTLGLGRVF